MLGKCPVHINQTLMMAKDQDRQEGIHLPQQPQDMTRTGVEVPVRCKRRQAAYREYWLSVTATGRVESSELAWNRP